MYLTILYPGEKKKLRGKEKTTEMWRNTLMWETVKTNAWQILGLFPFKCSHYTRLTETMDELVKLKMF